jgi:hypothetical protein
VGGEGHPPTIASIPCAQGRCATCFVRFPNDNVELSVVAHQHFLVAIVVLGGAFLTSKVGS